MRSNALWGIIFLILIIAGVVVWVFAGQPVLAPTVEEIPGTTTGQEQAGPMTPAQLIARVVVGSPTEGQTVGRSFAVTGKAPGPWYFEASFPVEVRDSAGNMVASTFATAQTDWMTTEDVAFRADVAVSDYSGPATLILHRDNASGLPEHEASVSIPITIQ